MASEASELAPTRERIAQAADHFGLDSRASYEFVYAVNEAVTNAIKHGSPDLDGTISVRIHAEDDALVCAVRDRGPFIFRPSKDDPEAAESGRGFALMSSLTDDLDLIVEPDATVVRLRKRRAGDVSARR